MAGGSWSRGIAGVLGVMLVGLAVIQWRPTDVEQPVKPLDIGQEALIWRLTAARSLVAAKAQHLPVEDQEALHRRLDEQDRELRVAEEQARNMAVLARILRDRVQIIQRWQVQVAAWAEGDPMFEAKLEVYREIMARLVASSDQRAQQALQRFADGEPREALASLDALVPFRSRVEYGTVDRTVVAIRRAEAWLAEHAREHGQVSPNEAVRRFEVITRLDPWRLWDWLELARLYRHMGFVADARRAAQSARARLEAIASPRERAALRDYLEGLALQLEAPPEAQSRFE